MTTSSTRERPGPVARRLGYLVAVLVNAVLLYAVNVRPGWRAVPFLTEDTRLVVGLVSAGIVVNLVANVVYLLADPRWLRALGDLVTTGFGIVVVVRILQVFPFAFGDSSAGWSTVVRVVLWVAVVGSAIGVIAALVTLLRTISARTTPPR